MPRRSTSLRSKTVMPRLFSFSVEASELDTAPSICPFIVPSASIKCAAVEPVPTPTMVPGCTYWRAAHPTAFFSSSCVMIFCLWCENSGRIIEQAGRECPCDRCHITEQSPDRSDVVGIGLSQREICVIVQNQQNSGVLPRNETSGLQNTTGA